MNEIFAGLLALGVPAVVIGSIVLWRTKPVLLMYYSLVLVGLGYLTSTGAVEDVGRKAIAYRESMGGATAEPAAAPVEAAAPAPGPASEPAPAAAPEAAAEPQPESTPEPAAPAQP